MSSVKIYIFPVQIILTTLFFLSSIVNVAYAAPLFTSGQTLDPNCAPTNPDCTVIPPATAGVNSDITALTSLTAGTSTNFTVTNLFTALAGYFTNLISTNSTSTNLNTTNSTNTNLSTTNFKVGTLNGLLFGTNGNVSSIATSTLLAGYLSSTTAASTYVPYTGANGAVNLGSNTLTAGAINVSGSTTLASSLNGLLWSTNGVVTAVSTSSLGISGGASSTSTNFTGNLSGDVTGTQGATVISQATIKTKLGPASAGVDGYLLGTDWNTFYNKVSSQWATSSSNIFYTLGNVGIGTSSPSNKLEVAGNGYFTGNLTGANIAATGTLNVSGKSTLANASTTNITNSGFLNVTGTTTTGGLSVGNLSGLLWSANGVVTAVSTSSLGISGSSGTSTNFSGNLSGDVTGTQSATVISQSTIKTKLGSAGSGVDGYLLGTDWNIFNNKLSSTTIASTYVPYTGATGAINLGSNALTAGAINILSTTQPQSSLSYDASNYITTSVNSTGGVKFNINGTVGGLVISNPQPTAVTNGSGTSATTSLSVTGATGGDTSGTGISSTGGTGGALKFIAGSGGKVTTSGASFNNGGVGGDLTLKGGNGAAVGLSGGFNISGAGGSVTLTSGAGGTSSSGSTNIDGAGGSMYVYAGNGGTNNGSGGNTFIAGGSKGATGGLSGDTYLGTFQNFGGSLSSQGNVYFGNKQAFFNTTSGNFGIGTTSPSNKLEVVGNSYFAGTSIFTGNTDIGIPGQSATLTVNGSIQTGGAIYTNSINYYTGNSTPLNIGNSGQLVLRYDTNNVGIGTTSPSNKLEVAGNGYFTGNLTGANITATGTLVVTSTTTTSGLKISGLSNSILAVDGSGNVVATTTVAGGGGGLTTDGSGRLTVNSISLTGSATSTIVGNISMTGDIIPTADKTYSLGSAAYAWKDLFVGPGSIYVNGQEVLHTDASQNVNVTADINQSLNLETFGTGNIAINPSGTGQVLMQANVLMSAGKHFSTSDAGALSFVGGIKADNLQVSGNIIQATNTNGGISLTPVGTGGVYVTSGNLGVGTTSPSQKLSVAGTIQSSTGGFMFPDGSVQTTSATAGSSWSTNAGNLYYAGSGSVGIGTTTPSSILTIQTIANANNGMAIYNTSSGTSANSSINIFNNVGTDLSIQVYGSNFGIASLAGKPAVSSDKGFVFLTNQQSASGGTDTINFTTGGYNNGPTMVITGGNPGNVGIGTTSPSQKLSVAGKIFSSTGGFMFPDGTTQVSAASGWTTSGNNQYSSNSGNVGIGGVPDYALTVQGGNLATNGIKVATPPGYSLIPNPGSVADSAILNARGFSFTFDATTISSGYQPGAGLALAISRSTPAMTLKNTGGPSLLIESGNVGIGTTAPGFPLEVNGTIASKSANPLFGMYDTDSNTNALYLGADFGYSPTIKYGTFAINRNPANGTFFNTGMAASQINLESSAGNADIAFYTSNSNNTNPSERMRILGNGNIGIGVSPSQKLTVAGIVQSTSGGFMFPDGTVQTTSATGQWTTSGSNIYSGNSGSVSMGTTSATAKLVISATAQAGTREPLFRGAVSDAPNSGFFIANGTVVDGSFLPSFGGISDSNTAWSQGFTGFVNASEDTSDSSQFGLMDFSAMRTTSYTDPFNGTLSAVVNRKLFTFRGQDANNIFMTIGANGNLSIGTSSASSKLGVYDSSAASSAGTEVAQFGASMTGSVIGSGPHIGFYGNNMSVETGRIHNTAESIGNVAMSFSTYNSSLSEKMRISASGNVGIGTTTPSNKLTVTGIIQSSTGGFMFPDGSVQLTSSSGGALWSNSGNNMYTTNQINVGIGTTTSPYQLAIASTTNAAVLALQGGLSTGYSQMAFIGTGRLYQMGVGNASEASLNVANKFYLYDTGSSSMRFVVSPNGNIQFNKYGAGTLQTDASGNITVSSDERLKNIQGNFTKGLDSILALNPINYKWKDSTGLDTLTTYSGFSAQNVQLVLPEAVGVSSDGYLSLQDRPILAAVVNSIKEIAGKIKNIVADSITAVVATFTNLTTSHLTVGSENVSSGITIYDKVTHQPFCIQVVNGQMQNVSGACDSQPNQNSTPVIASTTNNNTNTVISSSTNVSSDNTATSTATTTNTNITESATSTSQVIASSTPNIAPETSTTTPAVTPVEQASTSTPVQTPNTEPTVTPEPVVTPEQTTPPVPETISTPTPTPEPAVTPETTTP